MTIPNIRRHFALIPLALALPLLLTACTHDPRLNQLLTQINYKTVAHITKDETGGDGVDSNTRTIVYTGSHAYTELTKRFTRLGYNCAPPVPTTKLTTCSVGTAKPTRATDYQQRIEAHITYQIDPDTSQTRLSLSIP